MKDPLQTNLTAYEILGVPFHAGADVILKAFRQALPGCKDLQALNEARSNLVDPLQRLLIDLFLYQDAFLSADPAIRLDPESLAAQRPMIAISLENSFSSSWLDYRRLHTLAVFWYWWAVVSEECHWEGLAGRAAKPVPVYNGSLKELWNCFVRCWATLTVSPEFWKMWPCRPDAVSVRQCAERLQSHLVTRLNHLAGQYRQIDAADDFQRIQGVEDALLAEISMARRLISVDLVAALPDGTKGSLCYGRLMIERLKLIDIIRHQLDKMYSENSGKSGLEELLAELSPFGQVHQQLKSRHYDQAIASIMALPEEQQRASDAQAILLEAFLAKGRQQAEMDAWPEMIRILTRACDLCHDQNRQIIKDAAVSLLRPYLARLQISDPDATAELLQTAGVLIADTPDLVQMETDLLVNRAVGKINAAASANHEHPAMKKDQAIAEIKEGIRLLELAARKGSQRAKENLANAENLLKNIKSGYWGLPEKIQGVMNQAVELANKGDHEKAIEMMNAIRKEIGKSHQIAFNGMLAGIYNASGVKYLNQAVEIVNSASGNRTGIRKSRHNLHRHIRRSAPERGKMRGLSCLALLLTGAMGAAGYFGYANLDLVDEDEISPLTVVVIGIAVLLIIYIPILRKILKARSNIKNEILFPLLYRHDPPGCWYRGCKNQAESIYDLRSYGWREKPALCWRHGQLLQKMIKPAVSKDTRATILRALDQLVKARDLNPADNVIRKNLKAAEDLLQQIK